MPPADIRWSAVATCTQRGPVEGASRRLARPHPEAQLGSREEAAQPQLVEMLARRTAVDEVAQEWHHEAVEKIEAVERELDELQLEAGRRREGRHLVSAGLLVHVHEIAHGVQAEEAYVRRIRVVIRIGKVRHNDFEQAAGPHDAMDLIHERQKSLHMLERMGAE